MTLNVMNLMNLYEPWPLCCVISPNSVDLQWTNYVTRCN